MENQAGSLYLEQEAEIDRYTRMFSHLIATALDPEESRRLIARMAALDGARAPTAATATASRSDTA
jgi:hypothetical protein